MFWDDEDSQSMPLGSGTKRVFVGTVVLMLLVPGLAYVRKRVEAARPGAQQEPRSSTAEVQRALQVQGDAAAETAAREEVQAEIMEHRLRAAERIKRGAQ